MWATPLRCPHIHRRRRSVDRGCGASRTMACRRSPSDRQARRRPKPPSPGSTPCPTPCRARMPGHYSTPCGRRPCTGECAPSDATARQFACEGCRALVRICSCCDRGQIYCPGSCAREARHQTQRVAGQRYQASHRGRVCHAARARRYRARQKNVTHQGSPPPCRDDDVAVDATATGSRSVAAAVHEQAVRSGHGREGEHDHYCHWCGCCCSTFVRIDFLRRRRRGSRCSRTWRRA